MPHETPVFLQSLTVAAGSHQLGCRPIAVTFNDWIENLAATDAAPATELDEGVSEVLEDIRNHDALASWTIHACLSLR